MKMKIAHPGSRLTRALVWTAAAVTVALLLTMIVNLLLNGIPSIVYGLFGAIFFVRRLGCGKSLLAGGLTLAVMILPLVLRTAEEALKAVPDIYREGSFGLGAGRVRTVFRIILPAAAPGFFAGVLLGIGRIVGESAALVFTSGTVAQVVHGLTDSGRTLSVHLYAISGEGLYVGKTYATSVVLLLFAQWVVFAATGERAGSSDELKDERID